MSKQLRCAVKFRGALGTALAVLGPGTRSIDELESRVRRLLFVVDGRRRGLSFLALVQRHKRQRANDNCYKNDDQSGAATFASKHELVGCCSPQPVVPTTIPIRDIPP
jgi:hypothetical protein